MKLANEPEALIPPGHLVSNTPLEIVQIDHTQADAFVVDDIHRKPIGRPWLSVAIDVATRCVVAIYPAMERPNAPTPQRRNRCLVVDQGGVSQSTMD